MIYENILVMYAANEANDVLRAEKQEDRNFFNLIDALRNMRELDPEAYDELVDAMLFVRGDKTNLYSINLMQEYGVMDNPAVQKMFERQERILAIARSNKDVDSLLKAVKMLEAA